MNVYGRPDPIEEAKITGRSEGVNATVTERCAKRVRIGVVPKDKWEIPKSSGKTGR